MNEKPDIIAIEPSTLYRPSWIEQMLGRRCLQKLRAVGLRTVGGWYIGQSIIDSFIRAWQDDTRQRARKGEDNDKGHNKKEMGKNRDSQRNGNKRISEHDRQDSLRSQLDKIRSA